MPLVQSKNHEEFLTSSRIYTDHPLEEMALSDELNDYIHHHHLTFDPGWTFDFAEELVDEVSIAFELVPPSRSLIEDLNQTMSSFERITLKDGRDKTRMLETILEETWLIPKDKISFSKKFRDSIKELKRLEYVDTNWWDDGLLETQVHHIMDEFLLRRRALNPRSKFDEFLKMQRNVFLDGQQPAENSSLDDELVQIPRPEDLSDTSLQLPVPQYQRMKENIAQRSEMIRLSLASSGTCDDLLNDEDGEQLDKVTCRYISPPLITRVPRGFRKSRSKNAQEVIASVVDDLQVQKIGGTSPTLSSKSWNALDPTQFPSFTPPSSGSRSPIQKETEVSIDFLSSSEDSQACVKFPDLENLFETVLFSRAQEMPMQLDRSKSFNPMNHLNTAIFLFDDPKPVKDSASPEPEFEPSKADGNPVSFEIFKGLVGSKNWDDTQFEREIFGSPSDLANRQARLKRIPSEFDFFFYILQFSLA